MLFMTDLVQEYRRALPQYTAEIDDYEHDLQDAAPYPLTTALFQRVITAFRKCPDRYEDIKGFFSLCERLLAEGDSNVQDCIVLEAIEPVVEPDVKDLNLQRFLGPISKRELRKFLEAPKTILPERNED